MRESPAPSALDGKYVTQIFVAANLVEHKIKNELWLWEGLLTKHFATTGNHIFHAQASPNLLPTLL